MWLPTNYILIVGPLSEPSKYSTPTSVLLRQQTCFSTSLRWEPPPSPKQMWAFLSRVSDRGLLTLFNSSYKGFKGIFVKIQAPDHNPSLLEGFPLCWCQFPNLQTPRQLGTWIPMKNEIAWCWNNWTSSLIPDNF